MLTIDVDVDDDKDCFNVADDDTAGDNVCDVLPRNNQGRL